MFFGKILSFNFFYFTTDSKININKKINFINIYFTTDSKININKKINFIFNYFFYWTTQSNIRNLSKFFCKNY